MWLKLMARCAGIVLYLVEFPRLDKVRVRASRMQTLFIREEVRSRLHGVRA